MTAKYVIYFHFLCQQGGEYTPPPLGAELPGGGGSRPHPPPAETLGMFLVKLTQPQETGRGGGE